MSMSGVSQENLEEIFSDALEISSATERAAFLSRRCGGDLALRDAIEKKLAAYPAVESYFAESRRAFNSDAEVVQLLAESVGPGKVELDSEKMVGSRIGSYKLLQIIGEGGCGVVYMADQEWPIRRKVALKVIKLGMDTKNVIARFEAERQALAMMDHPNIARVLDAGATESGRPYFVMELVRGVKLTHYCDENQLDTRERLQLFIQICGAIQHAHQKGIIHRDIKPSNILVTMLDGRPVPKVIDFGIAKATGGERLTDNTLFTAFAQFIGTPAYMSPEQAMMSGMDVDTRSDIYSLGVLLYELLTGKTPFDPGELLKSGLDQMRRTLMECEPQRPSIRVNGLLAEELTQTANRRHVEPPVLKSLLSGDLDWIVMKALEKDRSRRYQTANGLGLDVARHLKDEAVVARPPSRWYRLQKLIRRNKATFIAIAVVVVSLLAGLGASTWMFIREREAREEQSRLREEAETARRSETQLRSEADARAKIAQAALLLNRGLSAEANALVDKIRIPVGEPSLEAAGVFRALGDWNVYHGRWAQAASCFLQLLRANQVDKMDMTDDATRDLLRAGPALVISGNLDGYHLFVRETVTRFANTTNHIAAEQVIKASLVLPPDAETLRRLRVLGGVVRSSITAETPGTTDEVYMLAWREFSLTLLDYRCGNFSDAIAGGRKCLQSADRTAARLALAHVVLAMAQNQIGHSKEGRVNLAVARELIDKKFPNGLENTSLASEHHDFWHDWLIACLLHKEAKLLNW